MSDIKKFNFLNFNNEKDYSKDKNLYKFNIKKEFKEEFTFSNVNNEFAPMFSGGKKVSLQEYKKNMQNYFNNKRIEFNKKLEDYFKNKKNEADEILKNAKSEADKILEEKSKQGYKDGFDKGYKEGLEKGLNEEKSKFEELKNIIKSLKNYERNLINQFEDKFKEIIIEVVKKIVKKEIEFAPDNVLKKNIEFLLERIVDKEYLNILIHSSQYDFLEKNRKELESIFNIEKIKLIKSDNIQPGGCIIESNFGTYDSRTEEIIAEFEKLLNNN